LSLWLEELLKELFHANAAMTQVEHQKTSLDVDRLLTCENSKTLKKMLLAYLGQKANTRDYVPRPKGGTPNLVFATFLTGLRMLR
jgi:hypothetical protein